MTTATRLMALTLVSLTLLACEREPAPTAAPAAPIVLIMADTLRADYVGAYGFRGDVSPHVDALAARGVLFENCVAQSPWTKPSIASLLTGLYPEVHKVLTEEGKFHSRSARELTTDALSEDAETLAEQLRARGYDTAAFVANPWIRAGHGYGQGFDVFDTEGADNEMPGAEIVERAIDWLAKRESSKPFFLYVHLMDVHGPYTAGEEHFAALADSSATAGPEQILDERDFKRIPKYLRDPAWAQQPDARDVRIWRQRYAAGMRALDAALGRLFDDLRGRGVFDDALIVFTSDHGEELHDHGRWDHGYSLYEHQTDVPLVIRYPQAAHAGKRVEPVVGLVDVMPTILAQAGAEIPSGIQGRDLTPLVRDEAWKREAVFAEAVKWQPEQRGVRSVQHKLIFEGSSGGKMLFDLIADPHEKDNIAGRDPQTTERLLELLRLHEVANEAHGGLEGKAAEVPPDVAERLRALGYLE